MCELIFLLTSLFKVFSFISSCMLLLVLKFGGKKHFCNGHSLNSYLYFPQPLFVILVKQPMPITLENEKVILARSIQKQLTTYTLHVSGNRIQFHQKNSLFCAKNHLQKSQKSLGKTLLMRMRFVKTNGFKSNFFRQK